MNYNKLKNIKIQICFDYIKHYVEKGYVEMPPLPLNYKKDITLDFTTCTICNAKENIRNNIKKENYVMIQPALRNTHIDVLGQMNGEISFFSLFSMMGGFKYYDKSDYVNQFSDIIKSEFDFLKSYSQNIILTIPIQYEDKLIINNTVLDYLNLNHCHLKYSENDEEKLKWKYGINNVVGYGTRWEIDNGKNIVNWGNTINIYNNGNPFGIDFGGGVESLLYGYLGLKKCIYANDAMTDLTKEFCIDNFQCEKIVDCIISAMCIISNKDKIILRDQYILNKYMEILYSLMVINNISLDVIMNIVNDINSKEILFLNKIDMNEKFLKHLNLSIHNFQINLNSFNIDNVLKLLDLCYNTYDENWVKNKKILKSHYSKYFNTLSEVELVALQKTYKKEREIGDYD